MADPRRLVRRVKQFERLAKHGIIIRAPAGSSGFMQRPLEAIVTSQTTMLKQSGQNGARLSNRQLATSYRKQIDQVRRIIESTSGEVTVLPVSYETALESPAETASAVSLFLGGGLDEAAMTVAVAPQLRRH